jgi:hypothetical protein
MVRMDENKGDNVGRNVTGFYLKIWQVTICKGYFSKYMQLELGNNGIVSSQPMKTRMSQVPELCPRVAPDWRLL